MDRLGLRSPCGGAFAGCRRLGGELSGEQGDISWKEGAADLLAQSAAVAEANGVILTTRTNTRWRGVLEFPIGPHRVGRLTYKA